MASLKDYTAKKVSSEITDQSLTPSSSTSGALIEKGAKSLTKTIGPAAIGATMAQTGFNMMNKNLLEIE